MLACTCTLVGTLTLQYLAHFMSDLVTGDSVCVEGTWLVKEPQEHVNGRAL